MACEAQLLSLTLSRFQGQQECHSWQGKACIHGYSLVGTYKDYVTVSNNIKASTRIASRVFSGFRTVFSKVLLMDRTDTNVQIQRQTFYCVGLAC